MAEGIPRDVNEAIGSVSESIGTLVFAFWLLPTAAWEGTSAWAGEKWDGFESWWDGLVGEEAAVDRVAGTPVTIEG